MLFAAAVIGYAVVGLIAVAVMVRIWPPGLVDEAHARTAMCVFLFWPFAAVVGAVFAISSVLSWWMRLWASNTRRDR